MSADEAGEEIDVSVAVSRTIESETLGETRQVLVNLPRGYEEGTTHHPVLIVLDGSPEMVFLARASLWDLNIPAFLIVAIPNVDRLRDMSHTRIPDIWPTSGGAESFLAFLTDELVPWIDGNFRTTGYRVITGNSAAGNFATFALLKAPETFHAAIARSPTIGTDFEMFRALVVSAAAADVRDEHFLYLPYGSHDYPVVSIYVEQLVRLLEKERPAWLRFERTVVEDRGHFQLSSINAGMSSLFADYRFPAEQFLCDGPEAVSHRAQILGKRFKTGVQAGSLTDSRNLVDAACDLGRQRRFTDAIEILTYGLELHPDSARMTYYLAQLLEHAGMTREAIATYDRALQMEPSAGIAGMITMFRGNLIASTQPQNQSTSSD
jgi:predicted alpha/beta superfamily hydrolase